jgi:MFS superfamily sulfate permease-like transporter
MAKTSVLGIILASPVFWIFVRDIPAQYPTVDLFAAPFLADIAWIIDDELYLDKNVSDAENDEMFVASFIFLSSISLLFSGALLVLASVFKLANIGMFLPFHVLSGFFSAVGVLTWTLAFKIDANGLSVSQVFLSGDIKLIINSLLHHAPGVLVAAVMNYMGPKNPLFVVALVFSTIAVFYVTMFLFHISLDDMIDRHWFWKQSDLHYSSNQLSVSSWIVV